MATRSPRPLVTVVGSSNTDMVINTPTLPRPGETVLGGVFRTAAGGKGANQAVAAARAGGDVRFVARVGDDNLGRAALAGFRKDRIDVGRVLPTEGTASGVALITVDRAGENCIAVAPGANGLVTPADVERAFQDVAPPAVVLVQLEIPLEAVKATVRMGRVLGAVVVLNPAPARVLPPAILKLVDVLTPNESEAALLTGIEVRDQVGAGKAAAKLRDMGVRCVIVTLGAKGAWIQDDTGGRLIPGFKMKAVDTTAAGDVFNGALAVALGEGKQVAEAVRFANAAAGISVTRLGAQPSAPTRAEITKLLGA